MWKIALARAFYTAVWLKQRATLGAQVVLTSEDQLLLVRHTYKPGWHLPGGGVEPPETPESTARREVGEETSYVVDGALELVGVFHNPSVGSRRDYVVVFRGAGIQTQNRVRSLEIAEERWFGLHSLPEGLAMPQGLIDRLVPNKNHNRA